MTKSAGIQTEYICQRALPKDRRTTLVRQFIKTVRKQSITLPTINHQTQSPSDEQANATTQSPSSPWYSPPKIRSLTSLPLPSLVSCSRKTPSFDRTSSITSQNQSNKHPPRYERVLGAQRISSLDHFQSSGERFAVICEMPDWAGLFLELRENAVKALDDRSWDPVTLAVADRKALLLWTKWLDLCGTQHSDVLTGLRGWLIVFEVRLIVCICRIRFDADFVDRIRMGGGSGCIVERTMVGKRSLRMTGSGLMRAES